MTTCTPGDRPVAFVLRALGLGDLLVAVPALRLLRRGLPDHRIVLGAPAGLAPLVSLIDAVDGHAHVTDPGALVGDPDRPRGVAVAANLHGRGPQSHAALDALGPRVRIGHASPDGYAPPWDGPAWVQDPSRPERRRWCDLLAAGGLVTTEAAAAGADDLRLAIDTRRNPDDPPTSVVVHPGAAFGSKRWPVERFATVARALADAGHHVVVTGSAGERELTATVAAAAGGEDLGGHTDLTGLLHVVASARLVLAGDTGVSHVATALATPSVTLFGPVGPEQWGPPPHGPHLVLTDASVRRGERFADDPDPALLAVTVDEALRMCERSLAPPARNRSHPEAERGLGALDGA